MAGYKELFTDDRPFNMAIAFLERLNSWLNACNEASIDGDLLKWYRGLRVIYRMINFKVIEVGHEEQEEILKDLFDRSKKILMSQENIKRVSREMTQLSLTSTEILLDELETKLNNLLYEYEIIFPHKKHRDPKTSSRRGIFGIHEGEDVTND